MSLYHIREDTLAPIRLSTFADNGIRERQDLQRMLRESVHIIAPGVMVLAEEFNDWADSGRRADLLCLDENADLVVVELKRTETAGHADLQSIRYAAMVAEMTFDRAARAHAKYLSAIGDEHADAEDRILSFLGWDEPDEERFARDVRMVLASADFSSELTTAVLWLNERGLDIRCVRMRPHQLGDEILVAVDQIIPLPSAEAYQVRAREKESEVRAARRDRSAAFTGYWFVNVGEHDRDSNHRSWEDCRRYGFVSAGGKSVHQIEELSVGDKILAYRNRCGYVGAGIVTAGAAPWEGFISPTDGKALTALPLVHQHKKPDSPDDPGEHCIGVRWIHHREADQAVDAASRRSTVCRIRNQELVDTVLSAFGISEADWVTAGKTGAANTPQNS